MTRGRRDPTDGRGSTVALDVVAGLVDGPSAARVARVAVREAVGRGTRVRFLQVLSPDSGTPVADQGGDATFAAALRALREAPRVPVSFETAVGEPGQVLVDRSRGAGLLVVGSGDTPELTATAVHCLEHAACDVLTARPAGVRAAQ